MPVSSRDQAPPDLGFKNLGNYLLLSKERAVGLLLGRFEVGFPNFPKNALTKALVQEEKKRTIPNAA